MIWGPPARCISSGAGDPGASAQWSPQMTSRMRKRVIFSHCALPGRGGTEPASLHQPGSLRGCALGAVFLTPAAPERRPT